MRRFMARFILLVLVWSASVASAGQGKVCKVLPQYLDKKGQTSLSPSLYERDAYQFFLRKHPLLRTGLRLAIEWKAKDVDWEKVKLRAEIRGMRNDTLHTFILEVPARKKGYFSTWSNVEMTAEQFQKLGELVAWRVTLWDGDHQLGKQESFLWSGVNPSTQ
jgi:hypothetical protein